MLTEIGSYRADHAEIEKIDAVLPPHQIAWVGIGMEEAIDDDLFVVALQQLASGLDALWTSRRLLDRYALDLFHHQ